ncbi:MAG: SRPBCC family protein, partial [Armatimonadota bacterium]
MVAPLQPRRPSGREILIGMAAAQATGGILLAAAKALAFGNPYLAASAVIVVPLLMGFAHAFAWRRTPTTTTTLVLWSFLDTLLACLLAWFLIHEGTICLLIVFPLLWSFLLTGMLLGRSLLRERRDRGVLRVAAAPMLVGWLLIDSARPHTLERVVVTESAPIAGSPAQVWNHVVALGAIPEPPDYWLCRIGLPAPQVVRAEGPWVGARRDCIFTGNLVFGERITACEPGRLLRFDIVSQPRDPEILGHADVLRGEMSLRDNGDGTTTVVGRSAYALHVFPAVYFDLWAQAIGHA